MKSLWKLKHYIKPYIWLVIGSGLLAIPLAALRFSPIPLIKHLIDDLLVKRDENLLYLIPALLLGLALMNFVVRFFHFFLMRVVIARVNQNVRNDLYSHLMGLSADYFTKNSSGNLISRVGTDPVYIDYGISSINSLIREPLTFFFMFGYALYLDWKLTAITVLTAPALIWVFSATGRNLKRYVTRIQEENANIFSTLQESFTGFRVVKMFRLEKFLRKKFRKQIENQTRLQIKTSILQEASHPMVELVMYLALGGAVFYGANRIIHSAMTVGDFMAFLAAFAMMVNPIRTLNDVNIKIHQAASAADRISDVLSWRSHLVESASPAEIKSIGDGVYFDKVCFHYPDSPEREVLSEISFAVPKGKKVALVGQSGSGKSSLVSLLPRIFDISSGHILINGRDIREYNLNQLRDLFAIVSQDVFLFNDTIEENIRCGRLSATHEEIMEAAEKAHVTDFVSRLPEGFQTNIGDRGEKLSGGERQRLSIARAFLRRSPVLILDEATSNLDGESERIVQAALNDLIKDKTVLMIAHRLSTIREADQIIVIRDGRLVESGNHEELVKRGGEYAKFHLLSGGMAEGGAG